MTQVFCLWSLDNPGFWDNEGGWVQRLRRFLDAKSLENPDKYYFEVYNLGVSGNDSRQLLERFESEVKRPNFGRKSNYYLVPDWGPTIYSTFNEEYRLRTPKEDFEQNILDLISKAKEYTDNIIFVGDPIITIEGPIPWSKDKELSDSRLKNYTDTVRRKCNNNNIAYVDNRSEQTKEEWSEKLEDGCHPNDRGHQLIFEK